VPEFQRTRTARIIRGYSEPVKLIGGARTRAATSVTLPKFFPELEPSYQVALNSSAGRVIREDVSWSHRNTRGLETGGWLLSDPRWPDRIVVATVPGGDAEFSRTSLHLGYAEAEKAAEVFPHLKLIGDWHLHPSDDGSDPDDGQPSDNDRRAWMRGWEMTRSFWVGVIVTPAPTYLGEPKLNGWVTTGGDRDHLYCEPLRIREV
jgi:hypothetical protein